jgi:rhodanese-related sulfurtransferase
MSRRVLRQDLVWAAVIFGLAAAFGLLQHWSLVRLSWQGQLTSHLEKQRTARRKVQFQGVKTVSLAQAYALFQQRQALFIDARGPEEYAELHILGAVNLPPAALEQGKPPGLQGMATDRQLVVYCGQISCNAALLVAEKLQKLGYTRVKAFMGGFRAWDEAGYPADTSK